MKRLFLSLLIISPRIKAYIVLAVATLICLCVSIVHTQLAMHTLAIEVDTDNSTAKLGYIQQHLDNEIGQVARTTASWATDDQMFSWSKGYSGKSGKEEINKLFTSCTMSVLEIDGCAIVDAERNILFAIRDDLVRQVPLKLDPVYTHGSAIINDKLYVVAIEQISDSARNILADHYLMFIKKSKLNHERISISKPTGLIPDDMLSIIKPDGEVVHGHLRLRGLGGVEVGEIETTVRTPLWVSISPQKYLIMGVNATLFLLLLSFTYAALSSIRKDLPRPRKNSILNKNRISELIN